MRKGPFQIPSAAGQPYKNDTLKDEIICFVKERGTDKAKPRRQQFPTLIEKTSKFLFGNKISECKIFFTFKIFKGHSKPKHYFGNPD